MVILLSGVLNPVTAQVTKDTSSTTKSNGSGAGNGSSQGAAGAATVSGSGTGTLADSSSRDQQAIGVKTVPAEIDLSNKRIDNGNGNWGLLGLFGLLGLLGFRNNKSEVVKG